MYIVEPEGYELQSNEILFLQMVHKVKAENNVCPHKTKWWSFLSAI